MSKKRKKAQTHFHGEHECPCGCNHTQSQEKSCSCEHGHSQETSCSCGCEHGEGGASWLAYLFGGVFSVLGFLPFLPTVVRLICSALVYLYFGFSVWKHAVTACAQGKLFTEFSLMSIASLGAILIGETADAAAVMYLYSLGEMLSDGVADRTRKSLGELFEILPESATVRRGEGWERVKPQEVDRGETILVLAGERVPLDGTVCEGFGSADTSSVTGESAPLSLSTGVFCPSGAILREGSVELCVSEPYECSVVARLEEAVREASARKSNAEKKIARFAGVFTPIAFGVAALVALIGALLTRDVTRWLYMGLTVLVVSCPCSLVLSVPLTYYAGLGLGATRGIVFRGGEVMDRVARLHTVAFDKTGTLSEAKLGFDGVELYTDGDREAFLSLAYDVLIHSPHAAAVSFCEQYSGESRHRVSDVEVLSGRGILCRVDGAAVAFGNAAWMRNMGISAEDSFTTSIFGAREGVLLGRLDFSSHLKEGSREAVGLLRQLGVEQICVLSGDTEASVASLCAEAGIDEHVAHLTPSEKYERLLTITEQTRRKHARATVAFCGDGLNDSAVIAGADVGIAMGACGSALTVRCADVVLMDDDLRRLPEAVRIARKTSRVASENIALSLGIKLAVVLVGIVLSVASGGSLPLWLAIVADVGAAILAVLSALRAGK